MFRWTLTNDDTGEVYKLLTDPHGWKEVALEHERSERYDGIFLDFSLELSFHCKGGGKEFLDAIYDEKGSEGNVTILVEFSTNSKFRKLFEGRVNFASYKEEFRGKKLHTVLDIEKKGITHTLLSRDEMDVDLLSEISIGGVALNPYTHAPYVFNLHSKTIYLESSWSKDNFESDSAVFLMGQSTIPTGATRRFFHTHPVPTSISDLEQSIDSTDYWIFTDGTLEDSALTAVHDSGLAQPLTTPGTYRWSIDTAGTFYWLADNPAASGTLAVSFNIIKADSLPGLGDPSTTLISQNIFSATVTGDDSAGYSISQSGTVDMEVGEKIWVYWFISFISTSGTGFDDFSAKFTVDSFAFKIDMDSTVEATTAKVVAIHEAWSRICESICDQTLAFKSTLFGRTDSQGLNYPVPGYGGWTVVTDGLRIRGFEKVDDPVLMDAQTQKGIITNMKDMYDSCNAIWGVGLSIEDHEGTEVVRVEEKDYYYQDTEIYKISNIPDLEMSFEEEMCYNEVELGYEKWRIEAKGGLDEPNSRAKWVFPKIKNIKNTKNLISPYVAGMYPIEETRRNQTKFNVTGDTNYDDDIFIIATRREFSNFDEAERNENILITAGTLLAPDTAYNLRFNLFSNLDRTMNQFTTNLTKNAPQQINYSYLEGNGQMEFQYYINSVPQQGELNNLKCKNVQNTEMPNGRHQRQYPILLPELYTFTYAIPFSDYLNILDNPYGYISFSESERKYKKGYIKSLKYTIATQMAEVSLIRKFE